MRKLKKWELIFLIIFYPAGIIYFIIWLYYKKTGKNVITGKQSIDVTRLHIVRQFNTKIAGVTFGNEDGTSRQSYIKNCNVGDILAVKPTPIPDYPHALGVFTLNNKQLGNIGDEYAKEIYSKYPNSYIQATITGITGGNGKNYGCNILLTVFKESEQEAIEISSAPSDTNGVKRSNGRTVIDEIDSDVIGTYYENGDGTSRQAYIKRLRVGQELTIAPAPTKEYPDSIGVFTKKHEQIGVMKYQTVNILRGQYLHNDVSIKVAEINDSARGLNVTMRIQVYKK